MTRAEHDDWATVPNLLSLLRLALLALFCILVLAEHEEIAGAAVLAVAGITDFLDGYIARRFDQVSEIGKVLDPTVDRILLITAVSVIVADGAVPLWLTIVVLAREGVVALSALVLAALGAQRIDVLFVGKAGTFGLMACFPAFLIGHGAASWQHDVRIVAYVGLVPALGLAFIALVMYVPAARRALSGRHVQERAGALGRGGPLAGNVDRSPVE